VSVCGRTHIIKTIDDAHAMREGGREGGKEGE